VYTRAEKNHVGVLSSRGGDPREPSLSNGTRGGYFVQQVYAAIVPKSCLLDAGMHLISNVVKILKRCQKSCQCHVFIHTVHQTSPERARHVGNFYEERGSVAKGMYPVFSWLLRSARRTHCCPHRCTPYVKDLVAPPLVRFQVFSSGSC